MQISLVAVSTETAMTKTQKPYIITEVTYKNLTFGGKTESKKLMPFGATENAAKVLSQGAAGEVYEVTVVKNDKGYNDWTAVVKGTVGSVEAQASSGSKMGTSVVGGSAPSASRSTYETPEERAKKQIYIVRQSSISAAISLTTVGTKTKPTTEEILAVAKEFENFVFGTEPSVKSSASVLSTLSEMDEDVPY